MSEVPLYQVHDMYFDVIMLGVIALDVLSMATQSGKPSAIQAQVSPSYLFP